MTERFQAPPHGGSPDDERPAPDAERESSAVAAPEASGARNAPPPGTPQETAVGAARHAEPFTIDAEQERLEKERVEQERLVWTPPLPQYPPRPTRQEPVQYEGPRPQPAPQYAPQSFVPPQPAPPHAPAPHPSAQQQYAPAIAGGYSAPVANPYSSHGQVVAAPPAPRASKARVGRRMMRRTVRSTSTVGKMMFGVRPGLTVALLLAILFTGWLAYDKWMVGSGTNSATPNAATKNGTVPLPPETASVQSYLAAVQKGDTDAVWNALGPQEKAHRISRGDDKTVLDAVLKMEQQQGFTYASYHYVAGYGKDGAVDPTKGGMYFYVADVGRGTTKTSVPMVFVMDANGQISQVNDQLYDYVLQQVKGGN
ncbi:MAG: hypothetical protein M3176_12255 [Chloroflexota bacterium]|nr:hypothetical protein [Chloroflexota bacterium]